MLFNKESPAIERLTGIFVSDRMGPFINRPLEQKSSMEETALKKNKTKPEINLESISDENLLKHRICDLPLKIHGTWLEECIQELYKELADKGIVFRSECYLADEWLTPENETCVGIPFYLAHPTLIKLEKKFMIDAEGETKNWCMKLLRHETGHAICYAYNFNKRRKWQKIFGHSTEEYGDTYKFRAYSKNYVRHIDGYYAQYHPDEDFVETFAVWLTPTIDWRTQYKGWKALDKLLYVDSLMTEIKGQEPLVKRSEKFWRLSTLKMTLSNYYKKKRAFMAEEFPDFHDLFLKKIFIELTPENNKLVKAYDFIKKHRRDILYSVSRTSGEKKYIINDLLKGIEKRTQELKLCMPENEKFILVSLSAYVTSLVMNYLYTGHFRGEKNKKKKR